MTIKILLGFLAGIAALLVSPALTIAGLLREGDRIAVRRAEDLSDGTEVRVVGTQSTALPQAIARR